MYMYTCNCHIGMRQANCKWNMCFRDINSDSSTNVCVYWVNNRLSDKAKCHVYALLYSYMIYNVHVATWISSLLYCRTLWWRFCWKEKRKITNVDQQNSKTSSNLSIWCNIPFLTLSWQWWKGMRVDVFVISYTCTCTCCNVSHWKSHLLLYIHVHVHVHVHICNVAFFQM